MSFVPGFVKNVCGLFGSMGILAIGLWVLLQGTYNDNEQDKKLCHISFGNKTLLLIIFGEGALLLWHKIEVEDLKVLILISLFFACLLFATIMDIETHMVYDYVWWLAGGVAILLCCNNSSGLSSVAELVFFIILQEVLFARMYGRADCHAFTVCATLEYGLGMGMCGYLVHMLLAFLILAVVQLTGKNVARNGNLKVPVAFLPYISIGCWLTIFIV